MKRKINKLKKINEFANEGLKQKLKQAREDKRHMALVILELFTIVSSVSST